MNFTEYLKEQDTKQKILLAAFFVIIVVTGYILYANFLKKPTTATVTDDKLKPLNLNLKVLDSEVFNNLKNN